MEWEDELRDLLKTIDQIKPVIMCGDLNVAHEEIDLKNAKTNKGNSGFTVEERGKMTALLKKDLSIPSAIFIQSKKGPIVVVIHE